MVKGAEEAHSIHLNSIKNAIDDASDGVPMVAMLFVVSETKNLPISLLKAPGDFNDAVVKLFSGFLHPKQL